jgi:hypothetical protein
MKAMCVALVFVLSVTSAQSMLSADSLRSLDTLNRPLPYHGAVSALGIVTPYRTMNRDHISTLPYRTLEDVLEWRTPAYVLSTGLLGDWNIPLLFGERPRDQAFVFDGIAEPQQVVGHYAPAFVMPEFMEQLDILTGTDAAIIGGARSGTAYWVQQPWYNTRTPYTRIWYCQSAYDFLATDGTFSQNVAPNINATLGFRRMSTPGRFQGQWLDSWNTRALLRWNLSDAVNISLVHRFTNWGLGTSGGVNTALSDDPTNERTAVMMYRGLDQRLFRHQLSLLATAQQTPERILSASVALTTEEWNLYRNASIAPLFDSSTHTRWVATTLRGWARWEEAVTSAIGFIAGIDAALTRTTESAATAAEALWQLSPFSYLRWNLVPSIAVRGGARIISGRNGVVPVLGAALEFGPKQARITLDASTSAVQPASIDRTSAIERAHLLLLKAEHRDSTRQFALTAYYRVRTNAYEYIPLLRGDTVVGVNIGVAATHLQSSGVTVESAWRWGNLQIAPQLVFSFDGARQVPLLYATVSIRYVQRIGRNRISGEVFVRARTGVFPDRYIPFSWAYIPAEQQWMPAAVDGGTLALAAELGNATVKLAMGNVLSLYYTTLSTFPQLDRHITLSVAWSFFD